MLPFSGIRDYLWVLSNGVCVVNFFIFYFLCCVFVFLSVFAMRLVLCVPMSLDCYLAISRSVFSNVSIFKMDSKSGNDHTQVTADSR